MDPNAPRKAPDPKDLERLSRVQRRVASVLMITTVLHLSAGMLILGVEVSDDRMDARIGLFAIATVFTLGGIAATSFLNKRPWLSAWLILGLLPTAFAIWWTIR